MLGVIPKPCGGPEHLDRCDVEKLDAAWDRLMAGEMSERHAEMDLPHPGDALKMRLGIAPGPETDEQLDEYCSDDQHEIDDIPLEYCFRCEQGIQIVHWFRFGGGVVPVCPVCQRYFPEEDRR